MEMLEDEIVHWYKDDKGETHRTCLRVETDPPQVVNGFPRDGLMTVRIANTASAIGFRLNPDETLRLGTLLLALAREQLLKKRVLWQQVEGD